MMILLNLAEGIKTIQYNHLTIIKPLTHPTSILIVHVIIVNTINTISIDILIPIHDISKLL